MTRPHGPTSRSGALAALCLSLGLLGCGEEEAVTAAAEPSAAALETERIFGGAESLDPDGENDLRGFRFEEGETQAEPTTVRLSPDISHVRVGQKYHFELRDENLPGALAVIWEVVQVSDTEIRYRTSSTLTGTTVQLSEEQSWTIPPTREVAPEQLGTHVMLASSGMNWRCRLVREGSFQAWVPQKNGLKTFPPVLKQMEGETVTRELIRIE